MKNKKSILLIIVIIIALTVIASIILLNKKEEKLTVALYYTGDNLEYDIETSSYKNYEIELTPEQQKEIIKLYRKTNVRDKYDVKLAIIGTIELDFSDGNIITMDKNNDSYGYINGEHCIKLSKGFKEYILSIID